MVGGFGREGRPRSSRAPQGPGRLCLQNQLEGAHSLACPSHSHTQALWVFQVGAECEGPGFPSLSSDFLTWWSLLQNVGQERGYACSEVRRPCLKHALTERLLCTRCCATGREFREAETDVRKGGGGKRLLPGRQPLSREGGRLRLVGSTGSSLPGQGQRWQSPEGWQDGTSVGGKCPLGQECAEWGGPR